MVAAQPGAEALPQVIGKAFRAERGTFRRARRAPAASSKTRLRRRVESVGTVAVDAKIKELIAMVIGVAITMHAGPATIHGARAYAAFFSRRDGERPSQPTVLLTVPS